MADQFQTTFIPKGNTTPTQKTISSKKKVTSIVTLVAFLIFVFTAIVGGYIFTRQKLTERNIDSITQELADVRNSLDDLTITNITELSDRLVFAQTLLNNHLAPSEIFTLLERYTIPTIGFKQFSYDYGTGEVIKLSGQGVSAGFGSIVTQSDIMGESGRFSDVVFSNLVKDAESGQVSFTFSARIDRKDILFKNVVNADGANVRTQESSDNNQEN